jgi:serine/threonine-protein kinase RIM15
MREEREDLKEAAEQTLNVIVDLDLDGRVKWVSPSWKQVVGTAPETIEGRMIADVLVGNKNAFHDAIESLKEDDSRSRFIRVSVQLGPDSVLKSPPEPQPTKSEPTEGVDEAEEASPESEENGQDILNLEGQGIMVFDRTAEGVAHVS